MGRNKSRYNKGDAILLENECDNDARLFNYYKSLTLNRYRWSNLPNDMESRHIEKAIFGQGQAFFYNDKAKGLICLPCTPTNFNFYGDPLNVIVTGFGMSENIPVEQGVRILENDTEVAPLFHIDHYVRLMNETEQTIFMNLRQQKFPYIVPSTKANELTMRTMMNKINGFAGTIFVDEKLNKTIKDGEGLKVLKTDVPYLLDKLQEFKHDIESEMYTYLGLNNANTDKKERMLVDEVNVNNGQILMSLDLGFKCRENACKKINKKFGLNITVEKVIDKLSDNFEEVEEDIRE